MFNKYIELSQVVFFLFVLPYSDLKSTMVFVRCLAPRLTHQL